MRIEADPGDEPPPEAIPLRVSKGSARARRRTVVGVVALGLVAGLAATAFALFGPRERTPSARLAAARDAVDDATSFRFTLRTRQTAPGSTSVMSQTTERGRATDGLLHVTVSEHQVDYEVILDTDGNVYSRWAPVGGDIDGTTRWGVADAVADGGLFDDIAKWGANLPTGVTDEREQLSADLMALDVALLLYLAGPGPALDGPGALTFGGGPSRGIRIAPDAVLAAVAAWGTDLRSDGDTLVATLQAPDEAAEALGNPVPDGQVEIDLGDGDLPGDIRLTIAGVRGGSNQVTLTFSDWDDPMVVAVPSGNGVDRTPWLDEDRLRSTPIAPVAPPAVLGSEWLRVRAGPAMNVDPRAPAGCELLLITGPSQLRGRSRPTPWAPGYDGLTDGLMSLSETSLGCALAVDGTPFAPDGPGGRPNRRTEPEGHVEVLVGDTVVEVITGMEGPALDDLVTSLAPVELEDLVTAAVDQPRGWTIADEMYA